MFAVIVAVPFATPLTVAVFGSEESAATVAILSLSDDHSIESYAVEPAAIVRLPVSPTVSLSSDGLIRKSSTVISEVSVRLPPDAVIVAVPGLTAVTSPSASTVATVSSLLVQVTPPVIPVISAVSCCVLPVRRDALSGETVSVSKVTVSRATPRC